MSKNPILTSLLRQKWRALLLAGLFALITFFFVSKAAEYLIVARESDRAGSFYRAIGELTHLSTPSQEDFAQATALITSSPLVAYADQPRYSSGILQDLYNPDIRMGSSDSNMDPESQQGIYNLDVWFYGELIRVRELKATPPAAPIVMGYSFLFRADKVLAGYPERITERSNVTLLYMLNFNLNQNTAETIPILKQMVPGQSYFMRGWHDPGFTHVETGGMTGYYSPFQIKAIQDGLWFIPIEKGEELDLSLPQYAGIKQAIDIQDQNLHAVLLVGTGDMSALPQAQESSRDMFLLEGRWLNRQDENEKRPVMVISPEMAQVRGLGVGNTVTVTLRGLQNPYYGYIRWGPDQDAWPTYPTADVTYEIVGIYSDEWRQISSLIRSDSVVQYVPSATIPVEVAFPEGFSPFDEDQRAFTFVLTSSQVQSDFITRYQDDLAELGFGLQFSGDTGKQFWSGVMPVRRSLVNSVIIFLAVLTLAILIFNFIYIRQNYRNYAILRALGIRAAKAAWQILWPQAFLAATGILIGGVTGWRFAQDQAAQTLSDLPNPAGISPSTTLESGILWGLCAAIFAFFLISAWLTLRGMAKRPVLELLQVVQTTPKARRSLVGELPPTSTVSIPAPGLGATPRSPAPSVDLPPEQPAVRLERKVNTRSLLRHTARQLRRSPLKVVLLALIAAGFFVAFGWMQATIRNNQAEADRLMSLTEIQADIVTTTSEGMMFETSRGGIVERVPPIPRKLVDEVLTFKNVRSAYLETNTLVATLMTFGRSGQPEMVDVDSRFAIMGISDLIHARQGVLDGATITFVPGMDESFFDQALNNDAEDPILPVLVPEEILQDYGLKLNQEVSLADAADNAGYYQIIGSYSGGGLFINFYRPILVSLAVQEVATETRLDYETARFFLDPALNPEIDAFREEMEAIVTAPGASPLPLRVNFWDDELTAVVEPLQRNIDLLNTLYPIALALSVLIGAGLTYLLILQGAKDTALLRMLGITPGKVRGMVSLEHLLPTVLGLLMGMATLGFMQQDLSAAARAPLPLAAGLYLLGALLGALAGAVTVSNKKPLELLQVKE